MRLQYNLIKMALSKDGSVLRYVHYSLKNNMELVRIAFNNRRSSLQYAGGIAKKHMRKESFLIRY
jgi:hypothetical protein